MGWYDLRLKLLPHRLNTELLKPGNTNKEKQTDDTDRQLSVAIPKIEQGIRLAAAVSGALNFSCLRRSLAIRRILKARGYPARLVYGMGDTIHSAHAWVEVGPRKIDTLQQENRFTPFAGVSDQADH